MAKKPRYQQQSMMRDLGEAAKPTPQHRYPRGYSPERMAEIRSHLDEVVDVSREIPLSHGHPFAQPHGARLIQEAVARSTMPAHHLEGLTGIDVRRPLMGMGNGVAGQYATSRRGINLYTQPVKRPKRGPFAGETIFGTLSGRAPRPEGMRHTEANEESSMTLIHEVGHHVSQGPAGGPEEARADKYMVEHYRPDPRQAREARSADAKVRLHPGSFTYGARGVRRTGYDLRTAEVPEREPGWMTPKKSRKKQNQEAQGALFNDRRKV